MEAKQGQMDIYRIGLVLLLALGMWFMPGCAGKNSYNVKADEEILTPGADTGAKKTLPKKALDGEGQPHNISGSTHSETEAVQPKPAVKPRPKPYRPPVAWQPAFSIGDVQVAGSDTSLPKMKVGASIKARGGKVVLRDVLKGLAELKGMNVGWASDVDQTAMVDVHINPDDDFWEAIDNLLRQLDYFYEFKNNTIFVKYKDTRRFYVPVPFIKNSYKTAVGGDLLGAGTDVAGTIRGDVAITTDDEDIDIWKSIEENLSRILKLGSLAVPISEATLSADEEAKIREDCHKRFPVQPAREQQCFEDARQQLSMQKLQKASSGSEKGAGSKGNPSEGLREGFFYTIDKPLGIVTVTAPRSLLEQVQAYIESVKNELSRQVLLEAKIIEVRLDRNFQRGIDWSNLLSDIQQNNNFRGKITFGNNNVLYPDNGVKLIGQFELFPKDFQVLVNALDEYGDVKILSNPKLSLLNGQPAMITVGESVKYIDSVTSTVDTGTTGGTGIVTYTVDTASVLSGLGFSVVANIANDDEVILHLTPVTSELKEPIEYRQFGTGDNIAEVGLPRIKLRELTTMARIKSGQVLIIGGLISNIEGRDDNQVPLLGDVPLVGKLFKNTRRYKTKRELIILLKPQVVKL